MNDSDIKDLRLAFGQFATGVTIVTTTGLKQEPVGLTANSFSSVSLNPPMVLWSLAEDSLSKAAFENAEFFCVHVLTAEQSELSERFAVRGEDKFRDVSWTSGPGDVPLLKEFAARFFCKTTNRYPVGDHSVFIGEVLKFDKSDLRPLVFHGGQYALAERRMMEQVARRVSGGDLPASGDRRKKR